jgi:hypothetical protein
MSVTVGTLIIDLKANTASFSQSMDKMSHLSAKTATDIKRSLEKIALAGAAMTAALITGTAGVVRSALDQVDALGKAAQAAGTTAETLSTLQYAAKLSNVENEQLTKGLEKLSMASFKAQNGNVQLERIFERLGVTVADSSGHLKDSGSLLEELAVKFSGMQDGAGKTALAMAIFGKAGAGLIPMLNQYGENQAEVNDEAHRFGMVLSQSTVDVAMKAHDNLDRLSMVMKGMGFSLLSATLPALDELLQKLITISQTADLQGLARAFGGEVVKAVRLLGETLDFAVKHAHGLKLALEAIAAIKLATFAVPIIGDLQKGGIANIGAGLEKLTVGLLGIGRALPVLEKFSTWIWGLAKTFGSLAASEGIAETATLMLGEAFAGPVGWIALAVTAITGLGVAIYKFRDATFTVKGETYELRDVWAGVWIQMKDDFSTLADHITSTWSQMKKDLQPLDTVFATLTDNIKHLWSEMVDWVKQNSLAKSIIDDITSATEWVKAHLPSVIDDTDIAALDKAKAKRLADAFPGGYETHPEQPNKEFKPTKKQEDTGGLGKPKKDPYTEEKDKLDAAIAAQQNYLKVLDGTPDEIQKVVIAEKAHAVVLEVNRKMLDEFGHGLTDVQKATLEQKVTLEETLKSLHEYGQEIVNQQRSTELSIQQTRAMSLATMQSDEAVREATTDNAILALTYNKTAEQLARMAPELANLRELLTVKSNVDLIEGVNREIFAIDQEIASQRILQGAMLGTISAQDQAAIEAKTYALNQKIATTANTEARLKLIEQRDALIKLMEAQQQANDLQEARRALGGPGDEFALETEHLQDLVNALTQAQGGYLTYAQQIQVATAQQDIFDKAIDQTVQSMVRFGDARDGVDAFFLDMQKQAQSTASIVYDSLHSAFDKISEQLTQLVTGGKTSFAKMFEDIGRQMVQSVIKKELQEGLKKLGPKLGLGGLLGKEQKIDGSSAQSALWVRMAGADGSALTSYGQPRSTNELTDLIGPNPKPAEQAVQQVNQIAQHPPVNVSSALSDLPSFVKMLAGLSRQKSPFGESLGMPTGNELTDLPSDQSNQPSGDTGILSAISGMSQGTPKGTASSPFYVKTTGGSGLSGGSGGMGGLGSLFGGGSSGGGFTGDESAMNFATDQGIGGGGLFSGLLSKLGGLFSGGGGLSGGLGSMLSMLTGLIPHAEGGPMTPSSAYLVGEKGPEIMTGMSGQITSNANSMRALSSSTGATHYYSIDARGTDPAQTEQRVRRAILESHQSAVTTSIQGNAERLKRVPQRY